MTREEIQISQHQESTSSANYGKTPTPHTITDTATDINVGTKIYYSEEKVKKEAERIIEEMESLKTQISLEPKHLKAIYNLVSYASDHITPDDEPLIEECIELLSTYLSDL